MIIAMSSKQLVPRENFSKQPHQHTVDSCGDEKEHARRPSTDAIPDSGTGPATAESHRGRECKCVFTRMPHVSVNTVDERI